MDAPLAERPDSVRGRRRSVSQLQPTGGAHREPREGEQALLVLAEPDDLRAHGHERGKPGSSAQGDGRDLADHRACSTWRTSSPSSTLPRVCEIPPFITSWRPSRPPSSGSRTAWTAPSSPRRSPHEWPRRSLSGRATCRPWPPPRRLCSSSRRRRPWWRGSSSWSSRVRARGGKFNRGAQARPRVAAHTPGNPLDLLHMARFKMAFNRPRSL